MVLFFSVVWVLFCFVFPYYRAAFDEFVALQSEPTATNKKSVKNENPSLVVRAQLQTLV